MEKFLLKQPNGNQEDLTLLKVVIIQVALDKGNRYVICDASTGAVIDDAQHHGYTSFRKAENYASAHGWQVVNPCPYPESEPLF